MGGVGGVAGSMKLKRVARKLFHTCGSLSFRRSPNHHHHSAAPPSPAELVSGSSVYDSMECHFDPALNSDPVNLSSKTMCAICLEALNYSTCTTPGQAIFTAQCSHAFHFDCIASNVRHGGVTCPICRAEWTHLPRNLKIPPCSYLYGNQTADPILQILDDSIATFRVQRRSILRSARYDDDDPIEPGHNVDHQRLHLSIFTEPPGPSSSEPGLRLCVRVAHQPAIDLVLVACPNGPHLRLIKQSMSLVVFSLRPIDRLAVVTYSSAAARVFPLRRMTSYGKRAALQVIDRLFYMGQADPVEGLKKGVKVLMDRAYENPQSCILHLSDNPTRSYQDGFDTEVPIQIHRFHVGYSFGTSNGFVMHEFEEFLCRILGDKIRDIQLRIREDGRIVGLGELRSGEERRLPLNVKSEGGNVNIRVEYSYVEDGVRACVRTGEVMAALGDKREAGVNGGCGEDGRSSNAGNWDYHDPYMARRWAKHLHAYRL
ncbi:putative chromatin regulator PHD family [Helianthus annuus]|uniref:Chromatin regulator PHD family n=1 Tax=Helianthus annuus TaxID=4232 RepID=A0A251RS46_HELAN|nr:E3 ubiquitin-protein ligase WAV3 [Helianthus annuus]KAF5756310.1 putative chromatin regulator PHD family [Helianthus annuus]KAJ0633172.1 putative chromatin regulator PHD family [Helianthus annuus]